MRDLTTRRMLESIEELHLLGKYISTQSLVDAIDSMTLQVPKEAEWNGFFIACSNCDEEVISDWDYCPNCGQRLSWKKDK